jgi:hypothetical protein
MDFRHPNQYVLPHINKRYIKRSVADLGCLSRVPDPDFYPFRILDPKTATKVRGKKN